MITSSYREHPSTVPGAVLWTSSGQGASDVLPDGCMDLIWTQGAILLAGPDLVPFRPTPSNEASVGLRLPPGLLPHLIRVRAADLVNQRLPLADLVTHPAVRSVRPDRSDRPGTELEVLVRRLLSDVPSDAVTRATAAGRMLEQGASVSAVADRLAVEPRTLHRLGLEWFGYGPKTLGRILRLHRALRHAAGATSGATVAALSGYADQSHLNREARKITGRSFAELAARGHAAQVRSAGRGERGVEVDRVAVGIVHHGVPLPPDRVPGLGPAVPVGVGHGRVRPVDLGRAAALEASDIRGVPVGAVQSGLNEAIMSAESHITLNPPGRTCSTWASVSAAAGRSSPRRR